MSHIKQKMTFVTKMASSWREKAELVILRVPLASSLAWESPWDSITLCIAEQKHFISSDFKILVKKQISKF